MRINRVYEASSERSSEVEEVLDDVKNKFKFFQWKFLYSVKENGIKIYDFYYKYDVAYKDVSLLADYLNKKIEYLSNFFHITEYGFKIRTTSSPFEYDIIEKEYKVKFDGRLCII